MTKLSDRFILEEYVSEQVFNQHGSKSARFICGTLVAASTQLILDLENKYGRSISCTINNWKWGGQRVASGLRMAGTPYYSLTSAHAWGKGDDKQFKFKDGERETIPTKEVYEFILDNQSHYYSLGIRRIEHIKDAPTWIHWDTIMTPNPIGEIRIVRAK
tara:strand:- start:2721 stop:3200 length:480 start_codon:yes stop_codon:yes gene_type:complete